MIQSRSKSDNWWRTLETSGLVYYLQAKHGSVVCSSEGDAQSLTLPETKLARCNLEYVYCGVSFPQLGTIFVPISSSNRSGFWSCRDHKASSVGGARSKKTFWSTQWTRIGITCGVVCYWIEGQLWQRNRLPYNRQSLFPVKQAIPIIYFCRYPYRWWRINCWLHYNSRLHAEERKPEAAE